MPGKTSMQEAKCFFEKFASLVNFISVFDEKGGAIYFELPQHELIARPRVEFREDVNNKTVEWFSISMDVVRKIEGGYEIAYGDPLFEKVYSSYLLPQILSTYGQPTSVLVRGNRGLRQFDLLLSYSKAGFLVNYTAPLEGNDNTYSACPGKSYVSLWLWPPERNYTLDEAAAMLFGERFGKEWLESYLPIDRATSLDSDEFYEVFRDKNQTSCLGTPINIWPEP